MNEAKLRSDRSRLLVLALLVCGCAGPASTDDAGRPDAARVGDGAALRDGGETRDGGSPDAHTGSETDSGPAPDVDAGALVDASPAADAGAGEEPDAGPDLPRRFVAVGYGGHRTVSLDGRTWEHHVIEDPAGGDDPRLLRGVGYGDGVFVAVGNRVMTSVDGIDWTTRIADTGSFLSDAVWADGLWVVAGGNGLRMRSTDGGESFTDPTPFYSGHFRSLAAGNGVFVAVGHTYGGQGLWSSTRDGVTWSDHTGGAAFSQVTFGAGVFVAVGDGGRVSVSTDGERWDDTSFGGEHVTDASFADGELLVRGDAAYWSSTDGRSWTRHAGSIPEAIADGGDVYVGVTWSAPLLASDTPGGPWSVVDATRPALTDVAVSEP